MLRNIISFGARALLFGIVLLGAYVSVVFLAVNIQDGGIRGLRFTNIPLEAPTFGGQSSYMFAELDTVTDIDVLWAGSSHAYRTFDPRFFDGLGVSTFNLGTTAQTPLNTYFLLREHLSHVSPGSVVLEVYWNVFTWDGVESTMDLVANTNPARWTFDMAVATRDVRAVNALLRRSLDIRRPRISQVQPNLFEGDIYISRGFVEKDTAFSGDRTWPPGDLIVQAVQLDYLARTIELVQSSDVPILLMTQPLPQTTLRAMTNRAELHRMIQQIADRFAVPYVDYNGIAILDDNADFFDSHHLSQGGLRKFLPLLYETLVELRLIEIRQGG